MRRKSKTLLKKRGRTSWITWNSKFTPPLIKISDYEARDELDKYE